MALNVVANVVIRPPAKPTAKCPTMGSLLSDPDTPKRKVRIPKFTDITHTAFEPIRLNKHVYMPGVEYELPVMICDELETSIQNYKDSIGRQITGRALDVKVLAEIDAQKQFEIGRLQNVLTSAQMP